MAFPQGLNFRASSGYVTDGANEAFESGSSGGSANYPHTTPQGNTVGSEGTSFLNVDRNSALDRRLAGIIYTSTNGHLFRIDLPAAGAYNVRSAAGDASFGNPTQWSLRDTTTSLGNLATGSITAGNFKDANDVTHSAANWPANNTARSFTFSTTICRIQSEVTSGNTVLAHFYIEAAGAPAGTSGTLATTNAADTSSAAGTTAVTGSLARTNASDTSSAAGTTTVVGASARTNANDSASASGAVGGVVSGSASYTNAADTVVASGTTTVSGAAAPVNGSDTAAGSGSTTIVGAVAYANRADTAAASGAAGTVTGTVAYTNANDRAAANGTGPSTKVGGDDVPTRGKRERIEIWDVRKKNPKPAPVVEESDEVEEAVELIAEIEPQPIPRQPLTLDERAQAQKLASALVYKPVPLQTVPGIIAQKIELAPDFDLMDEDEEEALLMFL